MDTNNLQSWLSTNASSIYAGIISSIIVVFLQVFTRSATNTLTYFFTFRLILKQLISFTDNVVVISGGDNKSTKSTTVPDATAYFNLLKTLENIINKKVKHIPTTKVNIPQFPDDNIVCVGGPKYNGITEKIIQDFLPKEINFLENGNLQYYSNVYSKDILTKEDYALIVRIKNPINKSKNIILIAGCGAYGTLAGSHYFSINEKKLKLRRKLVKKLGVGILSKSFEFSALIKCKYIDDDVFDITLIDAQKLI